MYYRLQCEHYNVTPETKSIPWKYESIHEAMYDDLDEHFGINIEEIIDGRYNIENNTELIERLWNEKVQEAENNGTIYDMRLYVERGVSCFSDPKQLIEYFEEEGRDSLEEQSGYILVFDGYWVGYGLDDEDIVQFTKEIERIDIEEFLGKYKEV